MTAPSQPDRAYCVIDAEGVPRPGVWTSADEAIRFAKSDFESVAVVQFETTRTLIWRDIDFD